MNQGRKRMLECAEECLNMFFGGKISSRNNTIKIKFMQLRDILITDRIYRQFSVFLRHLWMTEAKTIHSQQHTAGIICIIKHLKGQYV